MKKVFSKEIFKQTIKQLVLISSLTLLLSVMMTVLLLATKYSVPTNGFPFDNAGYNINGYGMGPYIASAIAPMLIIVMFAGSVVITYAAFKYQNKRELSDKYHSLPYTKTQQFTSRTLAVLAMLYAIIIITMLAAWITMNVVGAKYIPMHIPMLALGYMSGTTLLVAITAAAMSFTGNLFANVTVAAVLLFLPRSILFVIGELINYISFGFVNLSTLNVFLDPSTNIPVGIVLDSAGLWQYHGVSETLIAPKGIIYTFVLALVYLAIALLLSNKRKSELAGKSFAKSAAAYVFASLATAPLFLFAGHAIVKYQLSALNTLPFKTAVQPLIIPMIFAIILFLVLSLIYRTKLKSIVKGFAMFFAVAVVSLCLAALGPVFAKGLINKHIDENKVEYITIDLNPEKNWRSTPVYTYGWLISKDVKIYDHKIIETMISNMDEAIDVISKTSHKTKNDLSDVNFWCTFHMSNGGEITRYIPIVKGDYECKNIGNLLLNDAAYSGALTSVPEIDEVYRFQTSRQINDDELSQEMLETILSETAESDRTKAQIFPYYLNKYFTPTMYPFAVGTVYLEGNHDNIKFINRLYIDDTIPQSQKLYLNTVGQYRKDTLDYALKHIIGTPMEHMQLTFTVSIARLYDEPYYLNQIEMDLRFTSSDYTRQLSEEQLIKMCEAFLNTDPDDFQDANNYARININLTSNQTVSDVSIFLEAFVPISDELLVEYEEWYDDIIQQ